MEVLEKDLLLVKDYNNIRDNIKFKFKKNESYVSNNKIKSEIMFDNKQEGECISYHKNGKIKKKYHMSNDKLEGLCYHYDENEKLIKTEFYIEGILCGNVYTYNTYFPYGLNEIYKIVNNKREGVYKKYYPTGEIMIYGNYINGLKEGVFLTYDSFGRISSYVNYVNDKKDGICISFSNDICLYEFYKNGEIKKYISIESNNIEHYYKDDNNEIKKNYEDNKLVKSVIGSLNEKHVELFFKNSGKLKSKWTLINNLIEGDKIDYFKNGSSISSVATYVNGEIKEEKFYYENGNIKETNIFKNNLKEKNYYYENGNIKETNIYKNNLLIEYSLYDISGNVYKSLKDNLVTKIENDFKIEYFIKNLNPTENEVLHGTYKKFDKDGKCLSEIIYEHNKMIKQTLFYTRNVFNFNLDPFSKRVIYHDYNKEVIDYNKVISTKSYYYNNDIVNKKFYSFNKLTSEFYITDEFKLDIFYKNDNKYKKILKYKARNESLIAIKYFIGWITYVSKN